MATALILLHGFTHTGASWEPVCGALGERYRPIAPDLRGHGRAAAAEPVTLATVLGDLRAVTTTAPTDAAPVLAGYSQGGRLALHLALALGPQLGRLVLIGASPGLADPAARAERRAADELLAAEISRLTIEQFAERWARTPVLAGQPPEVLAAVHADRLRNTPAGLARALRGLGTGALPPVWDRLGELAMPVTLIVGERDAKFRAVADAMAAALPDPEVVVVPDAGHAVHLERPLAVAAVLQS